MGRKTKQNDLTSPEQLAQCNPENIRLLNDFLLYLRSIQRSETTIAAYENDLQIFMVWLLENAGNKHFTKMTKRDLIAYQNDLLYKNENSPARVRRLKAAISSLSNYVENILDDEYPDFRNITNKVESPVNRPVREKTVWEDDELEELLEKLVEKTWFDKACFLALAMYSGRRKAELCRFRVSDFTDDKLVCDGALYKSAPLKTKGRGGGKMLNCYTLAKKFKPYLDLWLEDRARRGLGDSEWLFPDDTDPSKSMPISTANSWANTLSRMTGKNVYFHSMRHYHTTSLAKAGIPDTVITQILGWQSADMCRVYVDLDADDQIGMYFKNGEIDVSANKGVSEL